MLKNTLCKYRWGRIDTILLQTCIDAKNLDIGVGGQDGWVEADNISQWRQQDGHASLQP